MAIYLNKILLFLLLPTLLIANEIALEKVYEEVLLTYSTIYSYEASFLQINYWDEIDVYKSSEGKLYYNKENLLMDYSQPMGQKLLVEENSMTMYDSVAESHYWDISKKELLDQSDNTIKIKLQTPEEEKIVITISNKFITEFNIVDINKNYVIYKFSDIRINKKLPENIFDLTLPEDTSIIDTRNYK